MEAEEHYMEYVHTIKGVKYINDSRAVCPNALWFTLECTDETVVWITGGIPGRAPFDDKVLDLIKNKVRIMICVGDYSSWMHTLTNDFCITVPTMQNAVEVAHGMARKGEIVLLSPGVMPDIYKNYQQRGRAFKAAVMELPY